MAAKQRKNLGGAEVGFGWREESSRKARNAGGNLTLAKFVEKKGTMKMFMMHHNIEATGRLRNRYAIQSYQGTAFGLLRASSGQTPDSVLRFRVLPPIQTKAVSYSS
jgi:hypothetical protein